MEVFLDYPLQLVSESFLQSLQACDNVPVVSVLANYQPHLRPSSQQRTENLR